MNKIELVRYLEAIDQCLRRKTVLVVYGSAAFILLDEIGRASLDIDVAGPYSRVEMGDLKSAAEKAGLPVNPSEDATCDHIEWIGPARLCLPHPHPMTEIVLWRGRKLTLKTVSPAQLVASKLIRYDEIDQSDIRFLCVQFRLRFSAVAAAAKTLPPAFRDDPVVKDNLKNLATDMKLWEK